jgi:hypothetical protein
VASYPKTGQDDAQTDAQKHHQQQTGAIQQQRANTIVNSPSSPPPAPKPPPAPAPPAPATPQQEQDGVSSQKEKKKTKWKRDCGDETLRAVRGGGERRNR